MRTEPTEDLRHLARRRNECLTSLSKICKQAVSLQDLMPQASVITDEATTSACEKGKQWQLALQLLSLMLQEAVHF